MPVFTPTVGTGPRQELATAIVEGEGAIENLIGNKIMPDFPITRKTAHLPKLTLADTQGLRMIADDKFLRAPGTRYERIVAKVSDATISTDLRGQEIVIPNEVDMEWEEYLDLVAFFSSRFGTEVSGLTKEYFIAAQIFSTSNTARGSAISASFAYTFPGNRATIDVFGDIIGAIRYLRSTGEQPDFVAMSGPVYERVRQADLTLKYLRGLYGAFAEVTPNSFGQALAEYGIKDVFIGDAYYNAAADGATPSLTQLWSNTYIAVGRRGMARVDSEKDGVAVPTLGGIGVLAYWTGFKPGGKTSVDADAMDFDGGNYVETYPSMEINSMVVRVGMSAKAFIANTRSLVLIATSYA